MKMVIVLATLTCVLPLFSEPSSSRSGVNSAKPSEKEQNDEYSEERDREDDIDTETDQDVIIMEEDEDREEG